MAVMRYRGEVALDVFVFVSVTIVLVLTLYPFLYVLSLSISNPDAVIRNEVLLWPKGLTTSAYQIVFRDKAIWQGYYNTVWYTVVGTGCNLTVTVLAAYALSKRQFFARGFFMMLFVFTMFFGGGMIPSFIVVVKLGIYNTRWAMIFPVLVSTWNLIICRTFFQSLPEELFECARMEGCGEWRIVGTIVVPLSKPIMAVLVLFYAIGHWNSFFPALLYLSNTRLHPLQLYLRRVLILATPESLQNFSGEQAEGILAYMQIKYAVVVVTIAPIVTLYPLLQKYFVKGMMIGSLKG